MSLIVKRKCHPKKLVINNLLKKQTRSLLYSLPTYSYLN